MQFDKDLQSEHKDLFLETRSHFLDAHGLIETKERPTRTRTAGSAT